MATLPASASFADETLSIMTMPLATGLIFFVVIGPLAAYVHSSCMQDKLVSQATNERFYSIRLSTAIGKSTASMAI
jgi:hypothetical protein